MNMSKMSQVRETNENTSNMKLSRRAISSKGGALIVRSLSLFIAGGRKCKAQQASQNTVCKESNRYKMIGNGTQASNKMPVALLELLKRDTHFSREEIEALYGIYLKLVASSQMNMVYMNLSNGVRATTISKTTKINEGVDRIVFQELLHNTFDLVTEDTLMDRIFYAWDKNNDGLLKAEIWIGGLSVFLRGTFEEKMNYCFQVYDLNSDGYISKDEMFQLLKNCLVKQPQEEDPDEGVKDLVEIILRKFDNDKDGKVSFDDYQTVVQNEPLLLEAFGQCLPTKEACKTFLSTLQV